MGTGTPPLLPARAAARLWAIAGGGRGCLMTRIDACLVAPWAGRLPAAWGGRCGFLPAATTWPGSRGSWAGLLDGPPARTKSRRPRGSVRTASPRRDGLGWPANHPSAGPGPHRPAPSLGRLRSRWAREKNYDHTKVSMGKRVARYLKALGSNPSIPGRTFKSRAFFLRF